jgi:hypothetical protein
MIGGELARDVVREQEVRLSRGGSQPPDKKENKERPFCDVMLCGSCTNRRFGGMYRFHHQGEKNQRARNSVTSN